MNQMVRIGMRSQLRQVQERLAGRAHLVLIEPDPDAPVFFEPNPASFAARRSILEAAYRTTRARLEAWFDAGDERLVRSPWRRRERTSTVPSPLHESDGPRSASHLEQASERGA
jgi:hypothetical protein